MSFQEYAIVYSRTIIGEFCFSILSFFVLRLRANAERYVIDKVPHAVRWGATLEIICSQVPST